MGTLFERFAKMAKEKFGLTVVKSESQTPLTFESLFGISMKNIASYEVPYDISNELLGYDSEFMQSGLSIKESQTCFDSTDTAFLAA